MSVWTRVQFRSAQSLMLGTEVFGCGSFREICQASPVPSSTRFTLIQDGPQLLPGYSHLINNAGSSNVKWVPIGLRSSQHCNA